MNVKNTKTDPADSKLVSFPFLLFCIFALTRPIFTMAYFEDQGAFGLKYFEIYGIGSSILILAAPFFSFRRLHLNATFGLILFFCFYSALSLVWGGSTRDTLRFILPFTVFFASVYCFENVRQIRVILILLIISFIVPIAGSAAAIFLGHTFSKLVWHTGIMRYKGLFSGTHSLAHSMFIFIFISLLYLLITKELNINKSKIFNFMIYILIALACFNVYKSVTRTVFLGVMVLMGVYLFFRKKYIHLAVVGLAFAWFLITSETVHKMLFDIVDPIQGKEELGQVGSGRLGAWRLILIDFFKHPFEVQMAGLGVGNITQGKGGIGAPHNDLLSLLTSFGYVGFFLYLCFNLSYVLDLLKARVPYDIKYLYLAFMLAVMAMNLASNSYITRFELGQYLFMLLGFSYFLTKENFEKASGNTQ